MEQADVERQMERAPMLSRAGIEREAGRGWERLPVGVLSGQQKCSRSESGNGHTTEYAKTKTKTNKQNPTEP